MANYYFHASHGDSLKAIAHSQYILAEGKYKGKQKEIVFTDSNLPSWAKDPNEFWNTCAEYERVNARAYREFRFSLPNELSLDENKKIVNDFIEKSLENRFHYVVAIHDKDGNFNNKENKNIHCHLMFSEKEIDGIERTPEQFFKRYNAKEPEKGGAKKIEEFKTLKKLYELRKTYEEIENSYYEKNGFDIRVSCKSLKDQREEALLEGDQLKAEMLDREPINIRRLIVEKGEEKRTPIEQEAYDAFQNCIKERDIKVALYNAKLSGELNSLNNEIHNIESYEETENNGSSDNENSEIQEVLFESVFDEYLSNEKDITEINKKLKIANNKLDELELVALFAVEKIQGKTDAYNVYRNKLDLERELLVMDNFNSKNGIYFEERHKLEEKIHDFDLALDIRIEEAKVNTPELFNGEVEKIKNKTTDEKLTLQCSKVNLENRNIEIVKSLNEKNNGSCASLEIQTEFFNKNVEYNLNVFLSSIKELKTVNNEIKRIEFQLKNLKEITLNKMTKGEYSKINNLKDMYLKELKIKPTNIFTGKDIDSKGEKGFAKTKLDELSQKEKNMNNSIEKDKYYQIKDSIEIKLKEKLIYLKENRELIGNSAAHSKSNLIMTKDIRNFIEDKEIKSLHKSQELEFERNKIYNKVNNIEKTYSIENINKETIKKITNGENEALLEKYDRLITKEKNLNYEIEKRESSLNPIKMIEKSKLTKERNEVVEEIAITKQKHCDLIDNITQDKFIEVYSSYALSRDKQLYELNNELSKVEEKIKTYDEDSKILRSLSRSLDNYKGISEKHQSTNINFNKIMDHSNTGGGGQEVIESFFDELEKERKKNRDRDFSL